MKLIYKIKIFNNQIYKRKLILILINNFNFLMNKVIKQKHQQIIKNNLLKILLINTKERNIDLLHQIFCRRLQFNQFNKTNQIKIIIHKALMIIKE